MVGHVVLPIIIKRIVRPNKTFVLGRSHCRFSKSREQEWKDTIRTWLQVTIVGMSFKSKCFVYIVQQILK